MRPPQEFEDQMEISVLPAISELLYLLVILAGILVVGIGYIWLNYKIWKYPLYLPATILFGGCLAVYVYINGASQLSSAFFGTVPILLALYLVWA